MNNNDDGKIIKIYDPNIKYDLIDLRPALLGGNTISLLQYSFSSYSNQNASLTINIPSNETFVDRRILFKLPVQIDFTGDSNDPARNLLQSGYDSFRANPLLSCMETLSIKLNGANVSSQISDTFQPMSLFNNNDRNLGERVSSMQPYTRDQSQTYEQLQGSIRNPLASMYDSNQRDSMGRGGFPLTSFTNGLTTASLTSDLTCEMTISPLVFGTNSLEKGFVNLNKIQFTITFKSDLGAYMWSHDDSSISTLSTVTVTLGEPSILIKFITPQNNYILPKLSDPMYYPYNELQIDNKNVGDVLSGASQIVNSASLVYGTIPRYIYLFCRQRDTDFSFTSTNSYSSIESLSIQWNTKVGLFSSSTKQQLYDITRKNGLDLNYTEWSAEDSYSYLGNQTDIINGIGSVLCLEFGTDVPLQENEAPGLAGKYTFQAKMTILNKNPNTINYDLYVIASIPSRFILRDLKGITESLYSSKDQIAAGKEMDSIDYDSLITMNQSGGKFSFKKFVKKFAPKTLKFMKKVGVPVTLVALKTVAPELTPVINKIEEITRKMEEDKKERKMLKKEEAEKRRLEKLKQDEVRRLEKMSQDREIQKQKFKMDEIIQKEKAKLIKEQAKGSALLTKEELLKRLERLS